MLGVQHSKPHGGTGTGGALLPLFNVCPCSLIPDAVWTGWRMSPVRLAVVGFLLLLLSAQVGLLMFMTDWMEWTWGASVGTPAAAAAAATAAATVPEPQVVSSGPRQLHQAAGEPRNLYHPDYVSPYGPFPMKGTHIMYTYVNGSTPRLAAARRRSGGPSSAGSRDRDNGELRL